jgi:hypothetical protein
MVDYTTVQSQFSNVLGATNIILLKCHYDLCSSFPNTMSGNHLHNQIEIWVLIPAAAHANQHRCHG